MAKAVLSIYKLSFGFVFCFFLGVSAHSVQSAEWSSVYKDNYDYASQKSDETTTFNTWMWREDCNGKHFFQDTESEGCKSRPCVKLTAEVYDKNHAVCRAALLDSSSGKTGDETPYINAEMYNNSCVRRGVGHSEPQDFDKLLTYKEEDKNPWVQTNISGPVIQPFVIYEELRMHCDMPYPYDPSWQNSHPVTTYAKNSWNTTTPGSLNANPIAYETSESAGMWFRDLAWNAPYIAGETMAQKIEMTIKAIGDGPGSRGWGFWNTMMLPTKWQYAWFMEFTHPVSDNPKKIEKKLLAMTVTEFDLDDLSGGGICTSSLPDDIYKWQDYSIIWSAEGIEYRIDDEAVAVHTKFVPNNGMAFHNWVDNRNFTGKGPGNFPIREARSNLINRFDVYEKPVSGPVPVARASASTTCTSWETIVVDILKKDKSLKDELNQQIRAEIKSIRDLIALLNKHGKL